MIKKLGSKLAYIIIGMILAIAGTVYAVNVTIPQSTLKGDIPIGNANGTYNAGKLMAGANITINTSTAGQILITSSGGTAAPGGFNTQLQYNNGGALGGANLFYTTNDRFGINSTTPIANLVVQGSSTEPTINVLTVASSTGASLFQVTSAGNVNVATLTASSLVMSDAAKNLQSVTLGSGLSFNGSTLNTSANSAWTIGLNKIYNATSTDLVGIGTITPTTTLFVQGKGGTNPFTIASSTGAAMFTVDQTGALTMASQINFNSSVYTQFQATVAGVNLNFKTVAGNGDIIFTPNAADTLFATHFQTVGVNTSTPAATLSVQGTSTIPVFAIASSTGATMLTVNANNNIVFQNETLPTLLSQKFFTVVGSQAGGVARIVRDVGSGILASTLYGTYDVTAYSATTTIDFPDGSGPTQTFSIATGTMQNIIADFGAQRSGNDTTGKFIIRPYGSGVAAGSFTLDGNNANQFALITGNPGSAAIVFNVASSSGASLFQVNALPTNAQVYIQGLAANTTNILNVASSTGTAVLVVTSSSRVGIGTNTPAALLTLQGSSGSTIDLFDIASSTGTNIFSVAASANTNLSVATTSTASVFTLQSTAGVSPLTIASSTGTTIMTISSGDQFGFNTSTPRGDFQVTTVPSNATTTVIFGKKGQNHGSCLIMFDSTGATQYVYINASGALTVTTTSTVCGGTP